MARARAAFSADYVNQLEKITVPTLILTPSDDRLIGQKAARQMLSGIKYATEVVLENTGHMFRFTHPVTYAETIEKFLEDRVDIKHDFEEALTGTTWPEYPTSHSYRFA